MTVHIHPVETEADTKTEKKIPPVNRKEADHYPISLWDEHASARDILRIRERLKGEQGS